MQPRLTLPSGLTFTDPVGRLVAFCAEEYDYYDAIPSGDPDHIDALDVLATVSMNSFVNTADRVRSVHRGLAAACDPILATIPEDADLLDPEVDLDALERLLDAACQVRWVLVPVATKVLHRKRRRLIPMLDGVVNRHYIAATGQPLGAALEDGRRAAGAAKVILEAFRADLRVVEGPLRDVQPELAGAGYPLSLVRILELLVWTEVEPQGYYRSA